jgi:alkanesulfonate monooxygenase SsuD/methylene tetrahydromethanopterin reductase-like flavin-dependent oxidoreductase (luciferase family)
VARYADVWHADSLADYRENTALVDRLAEEAGRDPAAIGRAASLSLSEPWAEVRQNAELRRDLGMDYLVCSWPSEGRARVEEFWTTVAPDLAD